MEQPYTNGICDLLAAATEFNVRYAVNALSIRSKASNANGASTALRVAITNLGGQSVYKTTAALSNGYAMVSLSQLPAGIYMATVTDAQSRVVTCKFLKK